MGRVEISRLTNCDDDFYRIVGPFLSRREIVHELGAPVWDDDDKLWYVAMSEGALVGFAAVRMKGTARIFCSAYVVPSARKRGIYRMLLEARLKDAKTGTVRTTATTSSKKALRAAGFKVYRRKGNYFEMRMERA